MALEYDMHRNPVVAASLEPATLAMLDRVCRRQTRTRSAQIAHYVRLGLIADGVITGDDEPVRPEPRAA